jgi:hypothetical protein
VRREFTCPLPHYEDKQDLRALHNSVSHYFL